VLYQLLPEFNTDAASAANPSDSESAGRASRAEPEEEGGRTGWIVVAAATSIFFVTLGLVYSFGVMQNELIARGVASSSTLGWISSVTVVQVSFLSIPCNKVVRWLGHRRTGLIGALLVGTGYTTTSWALHSVLALFVTQAIFGAGYAFVFWASNSIAAQYFHRRRALAIGIVYSGSGVGGAVLSIALSKLTNRVGLEWAVRIFGLAAFAVLIPASYALKPKAAHASSHATFLPYERVFCSGALTNAVS
jgi:MFS family permease